MYFAQVQYTNYTEPQPSPDAARPRATRASNNVKKAPRPAKPFQFTPLHINFAALGLIVLVIAYLSAFIPLFCVKTYYDGVRTKLGHERITRESERKRWLLEEEVHQRDKERWQRERAEELRRNERERLRWQN